MVRTEIEIAVKDVLSTIVAERDECGNNLREKGGEEPTGVCERTCRKAFGEAYPGGGKNRSERSRLRQLFPLARVLYEKYKGDFVAEKCIWNEQNPYCKKGNR